MNWNDYEAVWKRQELPIGVTADLVNLRETFETKRRKLAASLLVRDWLEICACAVCIVSYTFYWRSIGADGRPIALAILLILAVAGRFLRERLRTRRNRLGKAASVRIKIEADLTELRHQRKLILNLWSWYLGPCTGAMLIHAIVIFHHAKPGNPIREPLSMAAAGLFVALIVWFAWTINRQTVRKRIEPRIEELEKLLHDFLTSQ